MHMCDLQAAKLEGKSHLFIAEIPDLADKFRNSKFCPGTQTFSLAFSSLQTHTHGRFQLSPSRHFLELHWKNQ